MLVLTPDKIELSGAAKDQDVVLLGNKTVDVAVDEIKELDPNLAKMFEDINLTSVKTRNFLIESEIDQFKDDFTASPENKPWGLAK